MDYKEKYEQLKKFIKDLYPHMSDYCKEKTEGMIPELKENEDEEIRKELLEYFHNLQLSSDCDFSPSLTIDDILAWLEKQDDQTPFDKVEQKFKAGNWYLCVKDFWGKGVRFDKGHTYYCGFNGYLQQFDGGAHIALVKKLYDYFNLWTIKDAKDGDVLSYNDGHGNDCIELIKSITDKKIEFWFCLTNGNRYEVFDGVIPYTNLASREDATPATKEQRDLLFQKIKEAGYEWDAEKKELKVIGEKPDKWSEEDEIGLGNALWAIEQARTIVKDENDMGNLWYAEKWLKSLILRPYWKPTKEQMKILRKYVMGEWRDLTIGQDKILTCLYTDLQKLL